MIALMEAEQLPCRYSRQGSHADSAAAHFMYPLGQLPSRSAGSYTPQACDYQAQDMAQACLVCWMWSQGLLTRVRDSNKHVQEAACSALATLEEAAGRELLESSRITAILKTLAAALQVLELSCCGIVSAWSVCLIT